MIFCRTKDTAERVYKYLERHKVCTVRVLHANKGQNTRINALDEFSEGKVRLLVTTDVTSRGIDVDNVSHVVNFELPKSPEDYLHRIGRTARIKRQGQAISRVDPAEVFLLDKIVHFADNAFEEMPWPVEVQKGEDLPGERQEILRELDRQKQLADPEFKGAFHERKRKPTPRKAAPKKPVAKRKRRSGKK
jgi:ATP-dependent RNA helicase RhlE